MIIRTPETMAIVMPTNQTNGDVQDIIGIQKTLEYFTETARVGEWAVLASAQSYDELHGLSNLVEARHCRWVIFKCDPDLYCLYITPLTGAKAKGKTAADYPPEVKALSDTITEGIIENGYSVAKNSPGGVAWLRACSTLLNKYDEAEVQEVLAWALEDEFWSQNVRSAPKFLKHYERLREQAQRTVAPKPKANTGHARKDAVTEGMAKFFEQTQTEEDPF